MGGLTLLFFLNNTKSIGLLDNKLFIRYNTPLNLLKHPVLGV